MQYFSKLLLISLILVNSVLFSAPRTAYEIIIILLSRSSEGKTVEIPYRGDVRDTILNILGGLRSACTYVGAIKLKELPRRTTFIRVTQQLNSVFS